MARRPLSRRLADARIVKRCLSGLTLVMLFNLPALPEMAYSRRSTVYKRLIFGSIRSTNEIWVIGAGIRDLLHGRLQTLSSCGQSNRHKRFGQPIYVGKAVPPGARKGGFGLGTAPGPAIFKRLTEHANSIKVTELKIGDFYCQYLVSEDIWIPLGESLLIEWFKPLWNVLIEGFGNHPTGKRRETQNRSRWDTLHPGRVWAAKLPPNPKTAAELQEMIDDFFAGRAVPMISLAQAVTEEEEEE